MDGTDNIEMAESENERIHETEEEEKEEEEGSIPSPTFLRDLNLLIAFLSIITPPSEDTSTAQEKQSKASADERVKTACAPRFNDNNHTRHQLQRKPRFQTIIKDFRHGKRM